MPQNQIPTQLKILAGNPSNQVLPKNEVKPKVIAPPPPDWIEGEAREWYLERAKTLERLGLCTETDGEALATVACLWQAMKYAYLEWVNNKNDRLIWTKFRDAQKELRNALAEFGMNPQARSKVASSLVGGVLTDDDMDILAVQ